VPVNINNLRRPRLDDTLVALAGPGMNILLAVIIVGLGKAGMVAGLGMAQEWAARLAILSLFLCFFNLLPIPPLDGSHVVKNLVNMSHETYGRLCQFGFFAVIVALQIPAVIKIIYLATLVTWKLITALFRFP
jgi:Zn-dependent protease